MRSLAIFFLLILLGSTQSARAQTEYFPKGSLNDDEKGDKFRREWYSEHLQAMKEPSLWEMSRNKNSHAYRFLYLRSFHNPIAVRVDLNDKGAGTIVVKILSGAGGYKPGHVTRNERRKLTKLEIEHLLLVMNELKFWELPSYPQMPPDTIGLDGAQWITEGVKGGVYHVVDRWSPERGIDRAFGNEFLIYLAKLKLLYIEVY
jgi:hypothetical protein